MTTSKTSRSTPPRAATETHAPAATPHWGVLPVVLTGVFMATLDFFIVNVAIPSTQRDLSATSAEIQWIVAGFGLFYGVGLITGGRLGDLYGRRRMFALGLALFTLASAACGLAPNAPFLVVSRALQGLSAALLAPQVLAILGTVYDGPAKARAFNAYGMSMGFAAVLGQLVGGLLIQADLFGLSWRTCFLINIPIGAVALFLVPRVVPESRAPGRARLDLPGVVLVTLALVAVVLPLIEGREQGWPRWTWFSFAASLVLFAGFAFYQERLRTRGGAPLIDLTLFRERAFRVGLLAQLTFFMALAAYYLVFALYVQEGYGLSALQAGLIFVPIGAGYLFTSTIAVHVARRLGRQVIALGGLIRLIGFILLFAAVTHVGVSGGIGWLIPGLVLEGAGSGLALAPLASTVLSRVSPHHAGAAAGVLTTGLQVGNAMGVAIIGVIFYDVLGQHGGAPSGYASAFERSLLYLAGMAALLVVLVQFLPRTREQDA